MHIVKCDVCLKEIEAPIHPVQMAMSVGLGFAAKVAGTSVKQTIETCHDSECIKKGLDVMREKLFADVREHLKT